MEYVTVVLALWNFIKRKKDTLYKHVRGIFLLIKGRHQYLQLVSHVTSVVTHSVNEPFWISFKFGAQHMVKRHQNGEPACSSCTQRSWANPKADDDIQQLQHAWKGLVFKGRRPLTYRDRLNILSLRFWD